MEWIELNKRIVELWCAHTFPNILSDIIEIYANAWKKMKCP